MPPSDHALLGASSSKRWLNCPPSARLGEGLPDTPSGYAAAGTLAHAIAELKVRKYIEPMSTRSYNSQMKKLKADEHYDKGMEMCIRDRQSYSPSPVFEWSPWVFRSFRLPILPRRGRMKE